MKARINITTPAGKSLEGYPLNIDTSDDNYFKINFSESEIRTQLLGIIVDRTQLHTGDKVTIDVL